jgi:hypothetical protein
MTTLEQAKAAALAGARVCWKYPDCYLARDDSGAWIIQHPGEHFAYLHWRDGVTSDYKPQDFFEAT